ncbi:MAG: hypothetical protein J6S67_03585 [Methanobrevibacter sp.]|nr:hypothetical protein [Methanobrevibacter sp.]
MFDDICSVHESDLASIYCSLYYALDMLEEYISHISPTESNFYMTDEEHSINCAYRAISEAITTIENMDIGD